MKFVASHASIPRCFEYVIGSLFDTSGCQFLLRAGHCERALFKGVIYIQYSNIYSIGGTILYKDAIKLNRGWSCESCDVVTFCIICSW